MAKKAAKRRAVKKKLTKKSASKKSTSKKSAKTAQIKKTLKNQKRTVKADHALLFSPLGDRVLVEQSGAYDKTPGGLFIPATAVDKPLRGKVLAVGAGIRNKKGMIRPMDVSIGDEVMFDKYAGSTIKIDGKEYLLISEAEIIGVVTK